MKGVVCILCVYEFCVCDVCMYVYKWSLFQSFSNPHFGNFFLSGQRNSFWEDPTHLSQTVASFNNSHDDSPDKMPHTIQHVACYFLLSLCTLPWGKLSRKPKSHAKDHRKLSTKRIFFYLRISNEPSPNMSLPIIWTMLAGAVGVSISCTKKALRVRKANIPWLAAILMLFNKWPY